MTDVRRYFNAFLEKYAGYAGDSVRPAERRKGYAAAMLRETFRAVKKSDWNAWWIIGSRKMIFQNGGVYESTVFYSDENENLEHYRSDLTADGVGLWKIIGKSLKFFVNQKDFSIF